MVKITEIEEEESYSKTSVSVSSREHYDRAAVSEHARRTVVVANSDDEDDDDRKKPRKEIVAGVFDKKKDHPDNWYKKFDDKAMRKLGVKDKKDGEESDDDDDDDDLLIDDDEDEDDDTTTTTTTTNGLNTSNPAEDNDPLFAAERRQRGSAPSSTPTAKDQIVSSENVVDAAAQGSGGDGDGTDNNNKKVRLAPCNGGKALNELRGPAGMRVALREYGVPAKKAQTNMSTELTEQAKTGPAPVGTVMDVTTDGGLRKRVLLQGDGAQKPQEHWRVWITMHCVEDRTGRLVFSTETDNKMMGFDLGGVLATMQVDLAIRSLSLGEEAEFFCRKELSFGGYGGCFKHFPKDRNLRMVIRLVQWEEMTHVPWHEMPERSVTKHMICPPSRDELEKVDAGATVCLTYECCLARADDEGKHPRTEFPPLNDPVFDHSPDGRDSQDGVTVWDRRAEFVFTLGEDQVPVMLEQCVLNMKRFEESDFYVDPIAVQPGKWPMGRITWGNHQMPPDPMEAACADDEPDTVVAIGRIAASVQGVPQRATAAGLKLLIAEANRCGANIEDTIVDVYKENREAAERLARERGDPVDFFKDQPDAVTRCEGSSGLRVPPAGRALRLRIKLRGLKNVRDQFHMFDHEKVIGCYRFKEAGNRLFAAGDYDRAILRYQRAYEYVCLPGNMDNHEMRVIALQLYPQVLSNMALCCLRMNGEGDALKARKYCDKALNADPNNVKTLYRLALAHRRMNNIKEAYDALKKAFKLDPKNKLVRKNLIEVKEKLKSATSRQKKIMTKAFNKLGQTEAELEQEKQKRKEAANDSAPDDGDVPEKDKKKAAKLKSLNTDEKKSGTAAKPSGNDDNDNDNDENRWTDLPTWMVVGFAVVFVLFIAVSVYMIRESMAREAEMIAQGIDLRTPPRRSSRYRNNVHHVHSEL